VKDEVKLANIFETFVERFNKDLNQVEDSKLRLRAVDAEDKVEGSVVPVDQFVVRPADQTEINYWTLKWYVYAIVKIRPTKIF